VEADFLAYTDVVRLLAVAGKTGKLPEKTSTALTEAYRVYRRRVHHLVLQERSGCVAKAEYEQHRQQVKAAWKALFEPED
jgi:glutamate-ammonia-ligase adenylyltransferase